MKTKQLPRRRRARSPICWLPETTSRARLSSSLTTRHLETASVRAASTPSPTEAAHGRVYRMYATATGVDVPLEQSVSNGPVLLRSARSLPEDDAVSMVLVRQEGTSTEDLLRQLQDDPRILSAEPNYVQRLDDPDQTALDESTPQVAAALGLDSSDAAPSAPASGCKRHGRCRPVRLPVGLPQHRRSHGARRGAAPCRFRHRAAELEPGRHNERRRRRCRG